MTYEISKKKSLRFSVYDFWYSTRISLLIELLVLGLAILFYFWGKLKSIFFMRASIILFFGSALYIVYLLVAFIIIFIHLWRRKESEPMTIRVLDNGELQFKYENIDCIVDRTKIKWVREHKTEIYFTIKLTKRKQTEVVLQNCVEEDVKKFILSCKENKGLKRPALMVLVYFLYTVLGFIITTPNATYNIDTKNTEVYEILQDLSPTKMLNDLCPMDLITYTPISQAYYYYDKKYYVFPTNPPIKGLITFAFSEEDYFSAKEKLQSAYPTSDWTRSYKGTSFYIHPNFQNSDSYGFIGYNDATKRIIFLGYQDGYIDHLSPIESDFDTFIVQTYGSRYPSN